jgi:hypothetical protein
MYTIRTNLIIYKKVNILPFNAPRHRLHFQFDLFLLIQSNLLTSTTDTLTRCGGLHAVDSIPFVRRANQLFVNSVILYIHYIFSIRLKRKSERERESENKTEISINVLCKLCIFTYISLLICFAKSFVDVSQKLCRN